jgi:hypothetical protein
MKYSRIRWELGNSEEGEALLCPPTSLAKAGFQGYIFKGVD